MLTELRLHEATFRALGSTCRIVSDVEQSVSGAVHRLEDLEARWSRFIPTSEVSLLNEAAGQWTEVSEATRLLLWRADEATRRTDGVVDCLMLKDLTALGYDRSKELLEPPARDFVDFDPAECFRDRGRIDFETYSVRIPHGRAFDPGGLGKGLAADMLMDDILASGATWALVSLGGDLRFGGAELAAHGWESRIEDPFDPGRTWTTIPVHDGALATSSTLSRRWNHEGRTMHHLLDPKTGRPVAGARCAATVRADDAWWADVLAKVLVIDPLVGADELRAWGAAGLVFTEAGATDLGLLS